MILSYYHVMISKIKTLYLSKKCKTNTFLDKIFLTISSKIAQVLKLHEILKYNMMISQFEDNIASKYHDKQ